MKLIQDVYLAGSGASGYFHPKDCNFYCADTGDGLDSKAIQWLINTHVHYDYVAYCTHYHNHVLI